MKKWPLVLFALTVMLSAHADENSSPAFIEGSNWGMAKAAELNAGMGQLNPNNVPGYVTDNPSEVNYSTNISDHAANMASQSELAKDIRQNHQNRPSGIVNKQEAWLQNALQIEETVTPSAELTGHASDCKPTTPVTVPSYQTLTCDEFVSGETKTCTVGQIVEVDAKHTYQCQSTRQRERLSCQKILNIQFQENITQRPSCAAGGVIASAQGERSLSASIRCQIDSPTLAVNFVCGWRGNPSTHTVTVNGSGSLDFSDCKPRRRSGDTLGVLPYSLSCNANQRCTLQISWLLSLSFDRPRTIRTVVRTPVDVWDNQCANLEARVI